MRPHCCKSKVGFCLVSDNSTPRYPSMNWVYSLSLGLTRWVERPKGLPVQCSWGIQINVQETGRNERKWRIENLIKNWFIAGVYCGPCNQANGRLAFEDDLRSGGLVHFLAQWTSMGSELAVITIPWWGEPGACIVSVRWLLWQWDTSRSSKCKRQAIVGLRWRMVVVTGSGSAITVTIYCLWDNNVWLGKW